MTSVASIRRMAYSLAKPQRAADRASPDIHVPLPLEGPGKGCCHRGRSPLRTTDRKLPGPGPRPGNVGVEGRGFRSAYRSEDTTVAPPPQRTPGRKPGSGALAEPGSEFPLRRIVNLVQPWSKLTILRSLKAKTRDYLRYRKAHTRTTGKIVHFSLTRPRKTVRFDRQRPKPTVFRIARSQSGGTTPERGRYAVAGA